MGIYRVFLMTQTPGQLMFANYPIDQSLNCWTCDGSVFANKQQALLHATSSGRPIAYHYNDHVFGSYDWSREPDRDLASIYRERAQQLRDSYDHLIVMFSGGSDSTTMLDIFIDNGIRIDEVMSYGGWNHCIDRDRDPLNLEVMRGGREMLTRLQGLGITWTHINQFDVIDKVYTQEDWILSADHDMCIHTDFVRRSIYDQRHVKDLVDRGRRVCYVWGLEKPVITVDRSHYVLTFPDFRFSLFRYRDKLDQGINQEWFYSDVTCADLMAKQVHIIINWLESQWNRPGITDFILRWLQGQPAEQQDIMRLIYPKWNLNTFSLGKAHNLMWSLKWVNAYQMVQDQGSYHRWHHDVSQFLNSIDPALKHSKRNLRPYFKNYPVRPLPASY